MGLTGRHQRYQLPANVLDERVDQRDVELVAGFDLLPRHLQAAGDHVRRLGSPASEPAGQFRMGRGGEEDQQGAGHALAHLPGALDVDLEKCRHPVGGMLRDGGFRGAVLLAGKGGPLQQLAAGHHRVECRFAYEMVFAPVDLAWPR